VLKEEQRVRLFCEEVCCGEYFDLKGRKYQNVREYCTVKGFIICNFYQP
jgi:hypothetical protein